MVSINKMQQIRQDRKDYTTCVLNAFFSNPNICKENESDQELTDNDIVKRAKKIVSDIMEDLY